MVMTLQSKRLITNRVKSMNEVLLQLKNENFSITAIDGKAKGTSETIHSLHTLIQYITMYIVHITYTFIRFFSHFSSSRFMSE